MGEDHPNVCNASESADSELREVVDFADEVEWLVELDAAGADADEHVGITVAGARPQH
ncbi:hypothetical protein [Streptomyces sp. NPDC054794]